jgi:HAD superfamily hydrolase (TIGR01549 family)
MAIKAIIFDCFGVLVTSARVALKNDYPKFIQQIDDLDHQADYGLITRQQFNQALATFIGMSPEKIEEKYWGSSVRVTSAFSWMKSLKDSGKYKIGMLSNVGRGFFESYFTDDEKNKLFDAVVLSSEVGVAKPEVAAYQTIADKLGVKLSQCVMIDDTYSNIDAAHGAGMPGVWFISVDQAREELDKILKDENA